MKRLFIALPVPQPTAIQIAHWQQQNSPAFAKPMPPENLHLTLAFLAQQDAAMEQLIGESLSRVQGRQWIQRLDQTGSFKKPQIGYLAPSSVAPELLALAHQIQHHMGQLGIRLPSHDFHPHVTLFRQLRPKTTWQPNVPGWQWPVDTFCLYQSDNGHYLELNRWPLTP